MGPGAAGWLGVVEEQRPPLNASLTGTELRRWYWLRSELATFARSLGVSAGGSKVELTVRLAAVLDGEQPPPRLQRPSPAPPLLLPLTGSTVLVSGQRCTQELRAWFVERIGAGFRFDAAMRSYVAEGGHTLDEAVAHWHRTGSAEPSQIGAQFELNRFSRDWHLAHPGGTHHDMLTAWSTHRSQPRTPSP